MKLVNYPYDKIMEKYVENLNVSLLITTNTWLMTKQAALQNIFIFNSRTVLYYVTYWQSQLHSAVSHALDFSSVSWGWNMFHNSYYQWHGRYLKFGWSRRVQYWLCSTLHVSTVLFGKKNHLILLYITNKLIVTY